MHFGKSIFVAVCVVGVTIAAMVLAQPADEILAGSPVEVKIGSTSICVGRQFINPWELWRAIEERGPVTGYLGYRAELNLFGPELGGLTPEHYKRGIAGIYDKRQYPADWVRITIFPGDIPSGFRSVPSQLIGHYYEAESTVDSGFKSNRAERQCVGKVAGDGWVQVQAGPECLDNELKYDNPVDASVVLLCNRSRCWLRNRLEKNGVWFDYDFPRVFLAQWSSLHARIQARITEWRQDRTCFQ